MHHTYWHLYFDDFFSSVNLLLQLFCVSLDWCGTLCLNRKGFPTVLKTHAMKGFKNRGESMTVMHKSSNLTVSVWQDNCPVATNADPTVIRCVSCKNKDV